MNWQPGIIGSVEELYAHQEAAVQRYGPRVRYPDAEERFKVLAGKRVMVRPSQHQCSACGADVLEVENASAIAVLPGWVLPGYAGAALCSSLVRTD